MNKQNTEVVLRTFVSELIHRIIKLEQNGNIKAFDEIIDHKISNAVAKIHEL